MSADKIYLFREAGGTISSSWFVLSNGPDSRSYCQSADMTTRMVWDIQAEGINVIDKGVPIQEFEKAYGRSFRELNAEDRQELAAAAENLTKIFNARKPRS